MPALAIILFRLALALWIGAVVFVSFVVAPAVFGVVTPDTAGVVMGSIFPRYYAFTAVLGVVALGSAVALWLRCRLVAWRATVILLAVMLFATTYAGAIVHPRARALRPALHAEPVDPAIRATFDRLHRRAVQLNGLVLLLGLVTIVITAGASRAPESESAGERS